MKLIRLSETRARASAKAAAKPHKTTENRSGFTVKVKTNATSKTAVKPQPEQALKPS